MDIVVPPLGESITEAVVARWLKQVGEQVAADEPVAELETDKITVELRAPAAGALSAQLAAEGATVRIGDVVGRMEAGGAAAVTAAPAAPAARPAPAVSAAAPATPSPGVAAMPAAPSVPAAAPAPVAHDVAGAAATAEEGTLPAAVQALLGRPLPPSVRRSLREHGGNGSAGMVAPLGSEAVSPARGPQVAAARPAAARATSVAPAVLAPVTPAPEIAAREKAVPMSPLRRRIAERLVQAQKTTASLTTFNEIDMSQVMALRERFKESFQERHKVKLGLMSFFAKAAIASLHDFPGLNAEIRGDAIVYKEHYDIGIAVGGGKGLVVPVVRNADRLSFAELEAAIADFGVRAKEGKLTLDELSGGTFTITNGGVFGSMLSTPLLNYPQTGIMGMHNIVRRPVAVGDRVEIRPVMYVALTYDHRVVDGREAVGFLVGVKQRIENPERLLFAL
ncbi:MAG TPA: 2-oxoglutarate dehydrogenase complex dihydrolipoyllysine-residue succinyltransferase [Polyangia bacterium]|nr:2-oxoglutarate dehydrogenase complex dihydrolipoyllysine-residue succinyltransferase [Polyangia bacterium]